MDARYGRAIDPLGQTIKTLVCSTIMIATQSMGTAVRAYVRAPQVIHQGLDLGLMGLTVVPRDHPVSQIDQIPGQSFGSLMTLVVIDFLHVNVFPTAALGVMVYDFNPYDPHVTPVDYYFALGFQCPP